VCPPSFNLVSRRFSWREALDFHCFETLDAALTRAAARIKGLRPVLGMGTIWLFMRSATATSATVTNILSITSGGNFGKVWLACVGAGLYLYFKNFEAN